ncbi:MAG: TonB-dependent receptor [Bacteroidales bacterium]
MKIGFLLKKFWSLPLRIILLGMLLLHLTNVSYADTIDNGTVMLEDAFHQIGKKYDVFFSYDRSLVSNVKVEYNEKSVNTLESALSGLLSNTELGYKIFDNKFIVVYQNSEQGIADLKSVIQKVQSYIDNKEFIDISESKIKEIVGNAPTGEVKQLPTTITVTGTVYSETGEPLSGVSIRVKGGKGGVATGDDGKYSISNVPKDGTLIFSYIGYSTNEVSVEGRATIITTMLSEAQKLDEAVVTGYSTTVRRALTGSSVSVEGLSMENKPVQSLDKALQGRAPGVSVTSSTGVPGGAVRVNIRGIGSINAGTEPMYIVDGVQLNSDQPGSRTSTNVLAYINPNDIESIVVLKDAAASAIYGSQAANGVILVTTKRGMTGKTRFTVNFYQGVSAPIKNMKVLNSQDLIALRTEAILNGNPALSPDAALAQSLIDAGLRPDLTAEEIVALPTYDWQSEAFKPGSVTNVELSASGGSSTSNYYLSASYNKHDGNVTGIDFERGSFRVRLTQEVLKRLSFDTGINLSFVNQNGNTGSWGAAGSASPQYTAAYMLPTLPIYNPDGTFNAYEGMPGTGFNPIQAATVDDNLTRQNSLIGNFTATYKILDNLSFKSFYGIDYRMVRADYYRDPRTPNGAPWGGYLIVDYGQNINFITSQSLNYNTTISDDHTLSALLGMEYRSDVRETESSRANNFPTHQFRTHQSAAEPYSITGYWGGSRKLGFFTQINYAFKDRYFVSAVARIDGSSRFGIDNRFGFFPGISAGWDIAQEEFIQNATWLDQLKLRMGYGVVGNDQINVVSSRGFYQGGTSYNGNAALRLQTLANSHLGWEKNATVNIGLDFALFNSRLDGSFEVYRRISHNLLMNRPLPYTSGFSSVDDNLGRVINEGIEIGLNSHNIKSGDFKWSSNFNIAFMRNEVKELYDGLESISNTIRVGYPLKIWYRSKYAGVNASNGRPMWYDKDGNITYLPTSDDNVPTKKGWQSDYFGGLTNTLSYKGLEFSFLIYFDMGRYMENRIYQVWYNVMSSAGRNTLQELYDDRWTTPGQITYDARLINGGGEKNSALRSNTSDLFLHDGSYARLKEVTLAYTLPTKLLSKLNISKMRIYITGINLFTLTNWIGYDPEFAVYGAVEDNRGILPQTKSITGGIQLQF